MRTYTPIAPCAIAVPRGIGAVLFCRVTCIISLIISPSMLMPLNGGNMLNVARCVVSTASSRTIVPFPAFFHRLVSGLRQTCYTVADPPNVPGLCRMSAGCRTLLLLRYLAQINSALLAFASRLGHLAFFMPMMSAVTLTLLSGRPCTAQRPPMPALWTDISLM